MNEQLRAEFNKRIKSLKLTKEATEELFLKFKVSFFDEGFLCVYCNKRMELEFENEKGFTLDHTIPKAKKGKDDVGNLEFVCFQCNSMKADKDAEWFIKNVKRLKLRKQKREYFKAQKATVEDKRLREAYKQIFQHVEAKRKG